jgi:hypothetical protein
VQASRSELARRALALQDEIRRLAAVEDRSLAVCTGTANLDVIRKYAYQAEAARRRRLTLLATLREIQSRRIMRSLRARKTA